MKAAGAVKVFSGPAGYALVILAGVAGLVIIWNKFNAQQGPPGSLGQSVGNNTGQALGSFVTGLGAAIQKPFDDWFNSNGAAPNTGDNGDPGTIPPGGG